MLELIAREILAGADGMLDTVQRLGGPRMLPMEHMRPVFEFGAAVARGESVRLVLSSAPRFGKTTAIEFVVAKLMWLRPGIKVLVISCTGDRAVDLSKRARALVERLGVKVPRDQRAGDYWVCSNGSSLRALGSGSAVVGVGADVLIVDDLVPSMAAASSEAEREKAETWFESSALGRMEPGASALVCAHRWSVDDISGRLIGRGWPVANVPAIDARGESSWPERWSTDALREKEREVGPITWAALYQGQPRPRGNAVFSAAPSYFDPHEVLYDPTMRVAIGVDPAATARTSADYSAILVAAFTGWGRETTMNVLDVIRMQAEVPQVVDRLAQEQRRWRAIVGIESVGGFAALPPYLRRANPTLQVYGIRRTVDKYTASIEASAWWARGAIRVPNSQPAWLPAFLDEVGRFTGTGADRNDDQVDAMTITLSLNALAAHAERKRRVARDLARHLPWG